MATATPAITREALQAAALRLYVRRKYADRRASTAPDFWLSQSHSTIRTQHGVVPFVPFPWQRAWADGITHRELILKSRDVGSSEICVRWACWQQLRSGGNVLCKADKHSNAINLVSIARHYLTSLPAGERPRLVRDNETELELAGIGTVRALARGGGRSERCRYMILTERAFWEDSADELADVSGALVADGYQIVESTANGFNEFHSLWQNAVGYRRTFVGRLDNPTHTPEWWAERQAELAGMPGKLAQEYPTTPEEAFVSSGLCLFDKAAIVELQRSVRPPAETRLNGAVSIWLPPTPGHRYVAGADIAEGRDAGNDDLDYSHLAVYDIGDTSGPVHVASLHGQWTPEVFAQHACTLLADYAQPLLGVELNNSGQAAILAFQFAGYPSLFWWQDPMRLEEARQLGRPMPQPTIGWRTTTASKPILEQELSRLIVERALHSYDARLWDECLSYVQLGNGRTGAVAGCHDDRVIAHGIALQMRRVPVGRPALPASAAVRFGSNSRGW